MFCKAAVLFAVILHFQQPTILFNAAPKHRPLYYPHWFFMVAVITLLWNLKIWPRCFRDLPIECLAVGEALFSLITLELIGNWAWSYLLLAERGLARQAFRLLPLQPNAQLCIHLEYIGALVGTILLAVISYNTMLVKWFLRLMQLEVMRQWRVLRLYWIGWNGFLSLDEGQRHLVMLMCHLYAERQREKLQEAAEAMAQRPMQIEQADP